MKLRIMVYLIICTLLGCSKLSVKSFSHNNKVNTKFNYFLNSTKVNLTGSEHFLKDNLRVLKSLNPTGLKKFLKKI